MNILLRPDVEIRLKFVLFSAILSLTPGCSDWHLAGNTSTATDVLGTNNARPINVLTNGIQRLQVTDGSAPLPVTNWMNVASVEVGDGISIAAKNIGANCPVSSIPTATIDMWTGCSNTAHIRLSEGGYLGATHNHFEEWANLDGFWFNTVQPGAAYIFNHNASEYGRLGPNDFWRFGANPAGANAGRRVEVQDNLPQLRLTNFVTVLGLPFGYTDFFTTNSGDLAILPLHRRRLCSTKRRNPNPDTDPTAGR